MEIALSCPGDKQAEAAASVPELYQARVPDGPDPKDRRVRLILTRCAPAGVVGR